ncbi:hypothetical protein [Pseudomonas ovata]|uniref:hypothetical protein n=1 Tax=Pseudomonas ovata TaxID=1839709 RepID=UPI000D69841C|nr:hypothetical protein [Pseudomonas ovata]
MSTYLKERSFIASLRSMPPYDAQLDFSQLVEEKTVVAAGKAISSTTYHTRSEEYDYLTATTMPQEEMRFWFLYRQWDNGTESYEIKARHAMFFDKKLSLGSLATTSIRVAIDPFNLRNIDLYVRPDKSSSNYPGWRVHLNNSAITSQALSIGDVGPVQIIAPNGNPLGVYNRKNIGNAWWAFISCAKKDQAWLAYNTVPINIMMNIKEINIADPLA